MAQGDVPKAMQSGAPVIPTANPIPFTAQGPDPTKDTGQLGGNYVGPFTNPEKPFPLGFQESYFTDPNQALRDANVGKTILTTTQLDITTVLDPTDPTRQNILNIPFVDKNAKVTRFTATFWILDGPGHSNHHFHAAPVHPDDDPLL